MILQVQSADADNIVGARRSLGELTQTWGHEMTDRPGEPPGEAGTGRRDKVLDPVSLAALRRTA